MTKRPSLDAHLKELREEVLDTYLMIEKLTKHTKRSHERLQADCQHALVLKKEGHLGRYDATVDYDDTQPEQRACLVCGLIEAGTRVTINSKDYWQFEKIIREPLTKKAKARVVTIEEQELIREIFFYSLILTLPLEDIIKRLQEVDYDL